MLCKDLIRITSRTDYSRGATMAANPIAGFLSTGTLPASGHDAEVDAILDAVRAHLGMEIAFAARFEGDQRRFTHIRTELPVPQRPGDCEPADQSYCHHVLKGRLPELIHDAMAIPFAHELAITKALPIGCHISVPLKLRDGSLYGSFCCLSRAADHSLTERDLNTVKAFADLASDQIERAERKRREREDAVARIGAVIAAGQPAIVYQPIHRLADGGAAGVEALARFPDREQRPPCDWFNEAAALGVGLELELAAVRTALAGLPYLPGEIYCAINVAPATVLSGALTEALAGAPDGRLVLEVTEHAEVASYASLREALAPLRNRVRVAVDDVGAGYAGLRHILDLEPDILKLDMGLTRDVHVDPARRALIGAMVDFASGIGCRIVAEGVESAEEAAVLRKLGVDYAQGWHYSKPMPPVAAQQYLLSGGGGYAPSAPMRASRPRRAA